MPVTTCGVVDYLRGAAQCVVGNESALINAEWSLMPVTTCGVVGSTALWIRCYAQQIPVTRVGVVRSLR